MSSTTTRPASTAAHAASATVSRLVPVHARNTAATKPTAAVRISPVEYNTSGIVIAPSTANGT